jgi:hypothetical protein
VSHTHVNKVRAEMEEAGDVETVSTSIDTRGRKQQAKKKWVQERNARKQAREEEERRQREERQDQVVAILIERLGPDAVKLVYAAMSAIGADPLEGAISRKFEGELHANGYPTLDDFHCNAQEFIAKFGNGIEEAPVIEGTCTEVLASNDPGPIPEFLRR